jgi:hypothetical protein
VIQLGRGSSAFLTDQEKEHTLSVIDGNTPTIILKGLTLAPELLTEVEAQLARLNG